MASERQKQEYLARRVKLPACPYKWFFACDDGSQFACVAPSEAGARRVLSKERPGTQAMYIGSFQLGWEGK